MAAATQPGPGIPTTLPHAAACTLRCHSRPLISSAPAAALFPPLLRIIYHAYAGGYSIWGNPFKPKEKASE